MTTTIDTDGRATGDTTPTRVLDLRQGDIITGKATWDGTDLDEVHTTLPVAGYPGTALVVWADGTTDTVADVTVYQVITGERAQRWRAHRDAEVRRDRFADQLQKHVDRFREGELPMPSPAMGAHLTVYMDSTGDVEAAAKTLGAEIERTDHAVAAVLPDVGDSDLSVRFQRYLRPEVDA